MNAVKNVPPRSTTRHPRSVKTSWASCRSPGAYTNSAWVIERAASVMPSGRRRSRLDTGRSSCPQRQNELVWSADDVAREDEVLIEHLGPREPVRQRAE